jgi:hypothetical protein
LGDPPSAPVKLCKTLKPATVAAGEDETAAIAAAKTNRNKVPVLMIEFIGSISVAVPLI